MTDQKPTDPALALVWGYANDEGDAKYNRDRCIRIARVCNRSVADIAEAAGLSKQAVYKILAKEVDNLVDRRKIKA